MAKYGTHSVGGRLCGSVPTTTLTRIDLSTPSGTAPPPALACPDSIYAIRERRHLWQSRPSRWLAASSVADVLFASTLAIGGFAMTRLPVAAVAGTLGAAAVFTFIMDAVKVPLLARLKIA